MIDDSIEELFPSFAAISIDGARAIGKTSTGRQRAKTLLDLDLSEMRQLIQAEPKYLSSVDTPSSRALSRRPSIFRTTAQPQRGQADVRRRAPIDNGDRTWLGDFFEALVALSLRTYAAANDAKVSHFRDHDGLREIDFISIEGTQKRWVLK